MPSVTCASNCSPLRNACASSRHSGLHLLASASLGAHGDAVDQIVEDHTIFLPNDISIEDEIVEGDVVEVMGLLRSNNVLVADTIRLVR